MDKTFGQALDDLKFSNEAKERMAGRLAAQARRERDAEVGAGDAPANDEGATGKRERRHARKPWRFAVAASLAGALLLGAGGVAYGTGAFIGVTDAIDDLFNGAPASTEVVNKIGRPIGASVSSGGITVTADAIIGDRTNYAIVFSLVKDDGTAFDVEPLDNGTLPPMFVGDAGVPLRIDGVVGAGGGAYFYDADPTDNAIQYVQEISVAMADAGKTVIGKTARASFSELLLMTDDGSETIATGDWSLKFTFDYEDTSIDVPAGFSTELAGMQADVTSITISPIAISVDYTMHGTLELEGESGKMSDADSARMNAFFGLPITVTLADGTVIDATESSASSRKNYLDGTTNVHKSFIFDTFVNESDIASIVVAGEKVWAR